VKNLNFNTDDEGLKEFFEKFGKVISAKVKKIFKTDS
jgi:RNA recognition motif-containing protein